MKANEAPEQYISKSALVAEINRRRESNAKERYFGRLVEDNYFLDFLDTLEVKEVDLEKEINEHWGEWAKEDGFHSIDFAKHFFELGLRSTITEEDCKLIWNIGDEIPNMPEEEFFKELLKRYKTQKGK